MMAWREGASAGLRSSSHVVLPGAADLLGPRIGPGECAARWPPAPAADLRSRLNSQLQPISIRPPACPANRASEPAKPCRRARN